VLFPLLGITVDVVKSPLRLHFLTHSRHWDEEKHKKGVVSKRKNEGKRKQNLFPTGDNNKKSGTGGLCHVTETLGNPDAVRNLWDLTIFRILIL
jgi:hypothetical protein